MENLKIIDLTRVLGGPYATQILADHGADVIKVEAHIGDEVRGWGPPFSKGMASYFINVNRNKRSIAIDLLSDKGKEILIKLLEDADVLIENFKPGTAKRLGIDYETVSAINSKLIYCSISGFGQTGPWAKKPAYDLIVQALGGIMSLTGKENQEPVRVGSSIGDITAGLFTVIGIQSAVIKRLSTKKGTHVDISMLDCQIAILENAVSRFYVEKKVPKKLGSRHPSIAPFEAFKTEDSYIIIAAGNDKLFEKLCNILEVPEIFTDEKFNSNSARAKNMDELKKILENKLLTKSTSEWVSLMEKDKIPCGPIYNIKDAVENPQVEARNMIVKAYHKVIGYFKLAGNPI